MILPAPRRRLVLSHHPPAPRPPSASAASSLSYSSEEEEDDETIIAAVWTFSPKCKHGCSHQIIGTTGLKNRKLNDETITAARDQKLAFLHGTKFYKQQYLWLCREVGRVCFVERGRCTTKQLHGNRCVYAFPCTTANYDTSFLLCQDCMRSTLKLANQLIYYRQEVFSASITPSPATRALSSMIHGFITRERNLNLAIVVGPSCTERYTSTVILEEPSWRAGKRSTDGIFEYSSCITINARNQFVQGEYLINTGLGSRTIIVARKAAIDECILKSGGKLKLKYLWQATLEERVKRRELFVVLAVVGTTLRDASAFVPNDHTLALFKTNKVSIVKPGQHYGCKGWYFAWGVHASYTNERIAEYACRRNVVLESRAQCERVFSTVKCSIFRAITVLGNDAGFDIVSKSCALTMATQQLGKAVNNLLRKIGEEEVDLSSLQHKGESLHFVSVNVCANAETEVLHTENDQGHTLIHSPHGNATTRRGKFIFQMKACSQLVIPLQEGVTVLFNARLLTHRQRIDKDLGAHHEDADPFWNLGCYSNRRFDNNAFKRLSLEANTILERLSEVMR